MTAEDGTPWFNAVDVCKVLGYSRTNDAVRLNVDEADTCKKRIRSGSQMREVNFVDSEDLVKNETLTSGGMQKVNFVDVDDLRITETIRSKLPTDASEQGGWDRVHNDGELAA